MDTTTKQMTATYNSWGHCNMDGWFPWYSMDVTLKYNKHGNLVIKTIQNCDSPWRWYQINHILPKFVFDRTGKCISHRPSKRAINAGAEPRWMNLSNIDLVSTYLHPK